jgi:hypothetical protein
MLACDQSFARLLSCMEAYVTKMREVILQINENHQFCQFSYTVRNLLGELRMLDF